MEKHEILSMKNCHRAATVQQIANPEYGVWKFEWRGQKLGGNAFYTEYAHIASKPCFGNATVISDNDNDMKFWEVQAPHLATFNAGVAPPLANHSRQMTAAIT